MAILNSKCRALDWKCIAGMGRKTFDFHLEHLRKHWLNLITVASVVLLLESFGVLEVPLRFSLLLINHVSASTEAAHGLDPSRLHVSIVGIDNDDYSRRYGGESPLDRCTLARDFTALETKKPEVVVVDFDLSPLPSPTAGQALCQQTLDHALDHAASRIVLLYPFDDVSAQPVTDPVTVGWARQRCRAGLNFATATLPVMSRYMVTQMQPDGQHGLAFVARHPDDRSLCDALISTGGQLGARLGQLLRVKPDSPINFTQAMQQAPKAATLHLFMQRPLLLPHSALFWGGTWGSDDQYFTPLGVMPGVWIHAAEWVTLQEHVRKPSPIWAMCLDIFMAYLFSIVVDSFWSLYARSKSIEHHLQQSTGIPCRLSSVVYIALVATFGMMCWSLLAAASEIYLRWQIVTAPLLIMICLGIDGFVSGPVEALIDYQNERESEYRSSEASASLQEALRHNLASAIRIFIFALIAAAAAGLWIIHPAASWLLILKWLLLVLALLLTSLLVLIPATFAAIQLCRRNGRQLLTWSSLLYALVAIAVTTLWLTPWPLPCLAKRLISVLLLLVPGAIQCLRSCQTTGRRHRPAALPQQPGLSFHGLVRTAFFFGHIAHCFRLAFTFGVLLYALHTVFK